MFPEVFSDGNRASEKLLFVVAEYLFSGKIVSGGAELTDPRRHYDDVLLLRVNALQRPLQVIQGVVVADGHHHVSRTNPQFRAFDGVALQELEVLLHMLLGESMFATVNVLRNGEDQEKPGGERNACHRGDRLGEKVNDGGGQ